ncbi:hypothetical protein EJB05_15813, partial [Eragrostis curvula]
MEVCSFLCDAVTDVAGEIVEVGSAVRDLKVGHKVLSKLKFGKGGGLAEYVAALECMTVTLPPGVSAADAAGLPISGLTALQVLMSIGTKFDGTGSGANILVTAAAGGVGTYAVQLAKLGNHHVTATCGARNANMLPTYTSGRSAYRAVPVVLLFLGMDEKSRRGSTITKCGSQLVKGSRLRLRK